jgi:hypothetical protein
MFCRTALCSKFATKNDGSRLGKKDEGRGRKTIEIDE